MSRYDWPSPPRKGDDPSGRGDYNERFLPRLDPLTIEPLVSTPVPAARRTARTGQPRLGVPKPPVGLDDLWFPIGPSVMTNGQASGSPNVAGRIRDMQVHPTGRRVYAASAGGGVWFSADRGSSWRPLDDFEASDRTDVGNLAAALSIGAVHVIWGDLDDGTHDVVWVGTGEQSLYGDGTRRTTRNGTPGGKLAGIGFLNRDPAVGGGGWTVVKGAKVADDADTLRGHSFYRIVADPGDDATHHQLFAATTNGLYALPYGAGQAWARVAGFATTDDVQPLDVVCTRTAPDRLRIWVASSSKLFVSEFASAAPTPVTPGTLTFQPVKLPDVASKGTRLQLATNGTKLFVLGRRNIPSGNKRKDPPAALWVVDASAAIAGLTGPALTGMPDDLYMSASDQSGYDMCITTHPTVAGRVYVGGAAIKIDGDWNAALYRCETTATTVAPTLIGKGVHSDVHVLRVGAPSPADATKRTFWVGCDGGVFRSDQDGDADSFASVNDGLAVLQPGFVACHPTNPGVVAAGFQDNGTAVRIGDTVWEQSFVGDGGGVVYDPGHANRYFRQYTNASWKSSTAGSTPPIKRHGDDASDKIKSSENKEAEATFFYSGADAIVHGGKTHLVLGSDRVWYSTDWGASWVTIPTASDPRAGDNHDLRQDVLDPTTDSSTFTGAGARIITVKLSADPADTRTLRAIALVESGVVWLMGSRTADNVPFTWKPVDKTPHQTIKNDLSSGERDALKNGTSMAFLPAAQAASDLAVHDRSRGPLGSCYVATTGGTIGDIARDTLWFFDGKDRWLPTGLHHRLPTGKWTNEADRVTAPALAVAVDPDDHGIVYVGTSVGVVRGVLAIGGTADAPTYNWTWEQRTNGLPEAATHDLAIFRAAKDDGTPTVKLLRAATQSRGVWELDLLHVTTSALTYLRAYPTDTRRLLPSPMTGPMVNGDPSPRVRWDDSPDVVVDILTTTTPPSPLTEAGVAAVAHAGKSTDGSAVGTFNQHPKVHVLVHHRAVDPLPTGSLRVALLRHDRPATGSPPIDKLWPVLVTAAGNKTVPASLPDGWRAAGATLWLPPGDVIETRMPRAVTFDVDLSGVAGKSIVLLAVVMSDTNKISAADLALGGGGTAKTVEELVSASPHAAAKTLQSRKP